MSLLADDVRRQAELLERMQLAIHFAHNRVFHTTAPSWEAALEALEKAAVAAESQPAEVEPQPPAPFEVFTERWEAL